MRLRTRFTFGVDWATAVVDIAKAKNEHTTRDGTRKLNNIEPRRKMVMRLEALQSTDHSSGSKVPVNLEEIVRSRLLCATFCNERAKAFHDDNAHSK
jgi:hypothetical protein